MTFCPSHLTPNLRQPQNQNKMSEKSVISKRRPGRPQVVTDSAKKRKKKEVDSRCNKSRINIGAEIDRWNTFKEVNGLKSNSEVAKVLLDSFESMQERACAEKRKETAATSTPAVKPKRALLDSWPDVSEISSAESVDMASDVSGLHPLDSDSEHRNQSGTSQTRQRETSSVYVNPFELSVDVSEDHISSDTDDDDSDEDYEPSINITLGPVNGRRLEDVSFAEAEFGDQNEDNEDGVDDVTDDEIIGPGLQRILSTEDQGALTDDEAFLMYLNPVLHLARLHIPGHCPNSECRQEVEIRPESVGSALYLKWVCKNGHLVYNWSSQPILNRRLHGGDLLLSASILLSGNNYSKVALMAKFLRLHFVSISAFQRMQRTYLVPAIEAFWESRQIQVLEEFNEQKVVLLGDGRMDSPGHCAQYCSYTMMENTTKKIVALETMDKRQTGGKSSGLEKACFVRAMANLSGKELDIGEVVTDAHMQITALMKKNHPAIKHSYDIWHAAKNIGKKVIKAGQDKSCKELLPWTRHIVNHFWHASQTAKSYTEFMGIWTGVLHHVLDEHEWLFNYGSGSNKCSHGPLAEDRETEWIKKGSKAHQQLVKIVLDRRLQNNVSYFLNFRSTAELENFQNHILMYAAKRFAYSPPVYRARNLLAALDYNEHINRGSLLNKDGSQRYQRLFNKKSGRWSVMEVKKQKTYTHIPELISAIVSMRLQDSEGMHKKVPFKPDDPRLISKTLAAIPPPATSQLVLEKKSRLKTSTEQGE